MADNPIYGIGLCGGALGLELGLEAAIRNYRTVAVVERETAVAGRMAQRIEEGSLPPLAWWDDVGTFDGNPWRGVVHIVSAGFPCQPFSVAGKRKGKEDERWIWPSIADRIEEVEPEIVFLENVPGLLLSTNSDFDRWDVEDSPVDSVGGFGTVLADLAELGFHAEWLCLRASDLGASHGRKRVFILAYHKGADGRCELAERIEKCWRPGFAGDGPAPFGHERHARSGWKAITGTEHISGALANPGNGRVQEQRRGSEGRTGLGPAGAIVGNPDEPGYSIRGDDSGLWECASTERTGDGMDHADSGGSEGPGIHLRSARPDETATIVDRGIGELEHPARSGEHGQDGKAGRGGRRGVLETSEQLGYATSGGRGECGEPSERIGLFDGSNEDLGIFAYGEAGRGGVENSHGGDSEQSSGKRAGSGEAGDAGSYGGIAGPGDDLGIFAYGPNDPRWQDVLVQYPWLRPSYSQAEAESDLRDLVDGMVDLVVGERTGALRALGNGVVPLQAAVAFRILLKRVLSAST